VRNIYSLRIEGIQACTRWNFAFALCCHSNATRTPIVNPPNNAQLGGIPYHSPNLHAGPCSSMGMRPRTDRHTDRRAWSLYISRRLRLTHAKCNNRKRLTSSALLLTSGGREVITHQAVVSDQWRRCFVYVALIADVLVYVARQPLTLKQGNKSQDHVSREQVCLSSALSVTVVAYTDRQTDTQLTASFPEQPQ